MPHVQRVPRDTSVYLTQTSQQCVPQAITVCLQWQPVPSVHLEACVHSHSKTQSNVPRVNTLVEIQERSRVQTARQDMSVLIQGIIQ